MLWYACFCHRLQPFVDHRHFVFVQITEYYLIRRGHYRVSDLYDTRKDGWYWYTFGFNFRLVAFVLCLCFLVKRIHIRVVSESASAYTAYIAGILINVVGFAGASCVLFNTSSQV